MITVQRNFKYQKIQYSEFNVSTVEQEIYIDGSVIFLVQFFGFRQKFRYAQCDFLPDFNSDKANLSEEQFLTKYGNIIVDGLDEFTKSALLYNAEKKIESVYKKSFEDGLFVPEFNHKFYFDQESTTELVKAKMIIEAGQSSITWHTMDRDEFGNSISIELNLAQIISLGLALGIKYQQTFQWRKLELARVRAMTKEQLIEYL